MYGKEVIEEAREEIKLIHNLTHCEDRHPRLTPIKELRSVENGCAIIYQSNFGNLKGTEKVVSTNIVMPTENLFIYIFILELIEKNKILTEVQAAVYFKQIVEVIKYCHSKDVTLGRNIKLMNCVFDDKR